MVSTVWSVSCLLFFPTHGGGFKGGGGAAAHPLIGLCNFFSGKSPFRVRNAYVHL